MISFETSHSTEVYTDNCSEISSNTSDVSSFSYVEDWLAKLSNNTVFENSADFSDDSNIDSGYRSTTRTNS